jgi:hypothetical protein
MKTSEDPIQTSLRPLGLRGSPKLLSKWRRSYRQSPYHPWMVPGIAVPGPEPVLLSGNPLASCVQVYPSSRLLEGIQILIHMVQIKGQGLCEIPSHQPLHEEEGLIPVEDVVDDPQQLVVPLVKKGSTR